MLIVPAGEMDFYLPVFNNLAAPKPLSSFLKLFLKVHRDGKRQPQPFYKGLTGFLSSGTAYLVQPRPPPAVPHSPPKLLFGPSNGILGRA